MKIPKILLTAIFTLLLSVTVFASVPYKSLYYDGSDHPYTAEKINLSINGVLLDDSKLPLQPINIDGSRTLVPLREVFENLGATVNFDSKTNNVTVVDGSNTVVVTVGSTTGYINGKSVVMDAAPKYVSTSSTASKKVMIPLRFVGEGLGYDVNYDAATRTVKVDKPKENTTEEIPVTKEVKLTEMNSSTINASNGTTAKVTNYTLPTTSNKSFVMNFDNPITDVQKQTLAGGRLVVDVTNSILSTGSLNKDLSVGTLTNVRMAQFATSPTPITRAVLTFNADTNYTLTLSANRKNLTISFDAAGKTPVAPKEENNATSVAYSSNGDTDLFSIYGETYPPEIYEVTSPDDKTIYIDIVRPNTILSNAKNGEINEKVTGVAVNAYRIYNLNDTTTRIVVSLDESCINSVVENGTTTKVYIKPSANVSTGGGNVTGDNGALSMTTTPRTATLKINKAIAGITSGNNVKDIAHTDNYMDYQYVLTTPTSLKYSIAAQNMSINNEILNSMDVVHENNKTKFVFNGNTVLYASVTEDSSNVIITIKAARDVYDKIIVIDAGHGGTDPGTKGTLNGTTYYEKNAALDMAKKASTYISADSRFKVYQTRPNDVFTLLYDRPEFSSNVQADMFISIHCNSSTSSVPNGIDTFYFDVTKEDATYLASKGVYQNDYRKQVTADSKAFAKVMQENLIQSTLLTDRSYKHADYAVLRQNEIPAILIETGFMSNQRDLTNIANEEYRTKVAKTIADTVKGYYYNY